ncbi:MAG: CARDB domain-containing protein [Thermoplasmatota archaeon]
MGWRATNIATIMVMVLLVGLPVMGTAGGTEEDTSIQDAPPSRSLVTIPKEHLRIISGGISQWGPYSLGIVNRTTSIELRLKNTADAPFSGIQVNLTLYWYDAHKGFSFDKGRIMYKDQTTVYIPKGDGALSELIVFRWVPKFAGAYVMNITIKLPGDPRPYTNRTLIAGLQYALDQKSITDGLWVGTDFWNGSSMDGWTSESDDGEEGMEWHVSDHPLASGYETLHTPNTAFWVGNDSSGMSPRTGIYSLVSPPLDLTRFNPDSWDSFLAKSRPQIYFLYKFRGNITKEGLSGGGGIYHWIRSRNNGEWGPWEPLLDPKGEWINLTGNTTNVIWDLSRRPFLQGDLELIGVDLGDYQGRTVQVKFEYHPSGYPEPGYVIDDIVLIGKETVDIEPFFIDSFTKEVLRSDPGESIRFDIGVVSKLRTTDDDVSIRVEAIEGSDFIDLFRDVVIEPGILPLPKASSAPSIVTTTLVLPPSSPSGDGWLKVRVFGSGTIKEVTFRFLVNSRRSLDLSVEGKTSSTLEPGIPENLLVTVHNKGNVEEFVYLSFITETDLIAEGQLGSFSLVPDEVMSTRLAISVPQDSMAGDKSGYIVVSRSVLPADAIDRIESEPSPGWPFIKVEHFVGYVYDLEFIDPSPAAIYYEIENPPKNGTRDVSFHLILANKGNSRDIPIFSSHGWADRNDIALILPENETIEPGSTKFVNITVRIAFPVPDGIYQFNVQATSSGNENIQTDRITLTLSIGGAPVSSGIYLVNGSLELQPSRIVLGQDVVISFTVRSFGFLDEDSFNALITLNNVEITEPYLISRYQDKVCQLTWRFDRPGNVHLKVGLPDENDPPPGAFELVSSLEWSFDVGYIDLNITAIQLLKEDGDIVDEEVLPGLHEFSVTLLNNGNETADIFVLSLSVEDRSLDSSLNLTLNVTDLHPGEVRNVTFKNIMLQQERDYYFAVVVDNNGRWEDIDISNDQKELEVDVGTVPPELPAWRNDLWMVVGFIITLLMTLGLLFYMLRRKL